MNIDATGPDEIRAALAAAVDTTAEQAEEVDAIAAVLAEAADWYESRQMTASTVAYQRAAADLLATAAARMTGAHSDLEAALDDFNSRDGAVAEAIADAGHLASATILLDNAGGGAAGGHTGHAHTAGTAEMTDTDQRVSEAGAVYTNAAAAVERHKASGCPTCTANMSCGDLWLLLAAHNAARDELRRVERQSRLGDAGPDAATWSPEDAVPSDELAAEDAAAVRWPHTVRALDGLVAVIADTDVVTITAGTAQQLADIDPQSWRDPNGKERYAVLDEEDLPKFGRALAAAGRAARQGKAYRRKITCSDIGDLELTVTPPAEGQAAVTLTVVPYADVGDAEDLDALTESDFGEVPDETEDDDGHTRPLTPQERAEIEADIRADYEEYLRTHPKPQPLVVNLTVPMVDRLRAELAGRRAGGTT